jgi:ribosome assembly protein YihI (activator of Der GTPase)
MGCNSSKDDSLNQQSVPRKSSVGNLEDISRKTAKSSSGKSSNRKSTKSGKGSTGSRSSQKNARKHSSTSNPSENQRPLDSKAKVNVIVTDELTVDHEECRHTPILEASDEQLVAEVHFRHIENIEEASREIAFVVDFILLEVDHVMTLSDCTDKMLLATILKRGMNICQNIDADLVHRTYNFGEILGEGTSGQVFEIESKLTKKKYACKVVKKDDDINDAETMAAELEIMKRLNHHNVVALYETFESPSIIWLVLEYVDGGDLNQLSKNYRSKFTEPLTALVIVSILNFSSEILI